MSSGVNEQTWMNRPLFKSYTTKEGSCFCLIELDKNSCLGWLNPGNFKLVLFELGQWVGHAVEVSTVEDKGPMAGKLGGVGGRDSRGGSADMAIEGVSAQMQAVRVASMPQEIE